MELPLLLCSLDCHGAPVLAACKAELIRVLRHRSAAACSVAPLCVFAVQLASPVDYIAEHLI